MATLEQIEDALRSSAGSGDTETQQRLSDAMRAHPTYQQNAKEKLDSGLYKYGDDEVTELGKDDQRDNMSKNIARSMGLGDDEVDVTQGMGTYGRFKLSFQPTEQDKVKHLEDTYGSENIRAVDIGGKMKLLYRDEQETGNQFRAVDEEGVSLADFFGDTAGEVLPVAGAVAGGVLGLAGGIPGSVAGAAAGGALARGAQDVATRVVSGEDIQAGEIAKRAGKEALVGAGIDLVTLGTGRFFSKFGGKGLADGFQKGIADASEVLQKRGLDVDLTAGMRTGADAAGLESNIAAGRPKSKIATRLAGIRDDLDNFREQVSGGVDSREAFAKNIESIRTNYSELIAEVAAKDVEASKLIQKSLQKKIDRLGSASSRNLDQFGKQLQDIHQSSRGAIDVTNADNFTNLKKMAENQKVSVTKGEVVASMRAGLARFKVLKDENVNKLIKEIEDGADTIGFQELRERLDQVADAISQSKVAGFSNKEKVATAVSDSMRDLRNDVANRSSPEFAKAFDDTMSFYKNEFLSTRRGAVGTSLAEKLNALSTTPQSAARLILSDPEHIRQTLRAVETAGVQSPSVVKEQLREAYRASIGLERGTTSRAGFQFNREVVEELWGKRGVTGLEALNDAIARGKKDVSGMADDDIVELLSAFSTNERNQIAKKLVQKGAAEAEADKLIGNSLIKKIIKGDIDYFQNEEFAKHLVNANQGDARKFLAAVPSGERQGIRQDVITDLFGRAQNGAQKTSDGMDMWNPDTMGNLLSKHKNTLKEVLGEKTYGEIKAANTLLKAAEARGGGAATAKLRGAVSGGGAHLFIVGDIFQSVKERFWGWAYGSGSLTGLLTGAGKDQIKERMEKALPAMLASSRGVQALARTTKEDPDLRERVTAELAPAQ